MLPVRFVTSPLCRGIPNFDFIGERKCAIGIISISSAKIQINRQGITKKTKKTVLFLYYLEMIDYICI